jgi:hypothetical protein
MYDRATYRLFVGFNGGDWGFYDMVPVRVARDFFHSSSLGKFLHRRLKNHFAWRKQN